MIGTESPKISVVMAVYNGEPYIKDTVLSVLNQTFADFEFIIVNDCSTDDTANVVASFEDPRIVLINNEVNMGSSRAGNVGVDMAKAKFIARIDADDLSSVDRFQKQYEYLESNPDIAVLGSSFKIIDSDIVKHLVTNSNEIAIKLFLGQNCIAHSAVMMRRTIFTEHDFHYNKDNPVSQDYELWADVSTKLKISNLPETLMSYRIHDNQISTKRFNEQQYHASRIVTQNLKQLIPNIQSEQIDLHLKLTGFEPLNKTDFKDTLLWGEALKKINSNYAIFENDLFETYIDELIIKRKKAYFNKQYILSKTYSPKLLASFIKESKDYRFELKLQTAINFYIKCLIFNKGI